VVRKVFDATPNAPLAGLPGDSAAGAAAAEPAGVLFGFDTLERAARRALAVAVATVEAVADPQRTLEKLGLVLGGAEVLLNELAKPADPKSPFKGEFGLRKHVAWSAPVAIADVKAIGAPMGAKVNDVLVAAMTGALRTYLKGRGVDVNHTTVRAMVPVDLRPPERVGLLGNDFGLVLLELPVAAAKAPDRLAQTKARMDRLKRSPEPVAMKFLFELFGSGPKAIQDLATSIFGSKASLVMTNVVGPKDPVYLAGVPVDQMMFCVPHPGKELGMGISILSYRGMASLAVIADAGLVPDPEAITAEFNREFGRMQRAAQRAPAPADAGAPPRTRGTTRTPRRREPGRPAH